MLNKLSLYWAVLQNYTRNTSLYNKGTCCAIVPAELRGLLPYGPDESFRE